MSKIELKHCKRCGCSEFHHSVGKRRACAHAFCGCPGWVEPEPKIEKRGRKPKSKESANSGEAPKPNTSSLKLPDAEEVFADVWGAYKQSTWGYPPTRYLVRHILNFIAGKIRL